MCGHKLAVTKCIQRVTLRLQAAQQVQTGRRPVSLGFVACIGFLGKLFSLGGRDSGFLYKSGVSNNFVGAIPSDHDYYPSEHFPPI